MVGSVGIRFGIEPRTGMVCSSIAASSSRPSSSATAFADFSGSGCWPRTAAVVKATDRPEASAICFQERFLTVLASTALAARASRAVESNCACTMISTSFSQLGHFTSRGVG